MMGIKKVVAGSRDRKREKRMNATTQAKTRNVYVREIMMPVIFCKDCKYSQKTIDGRYWCIKNPHYTETDSWGDGVEILKPDDFCSRGEKKEKE